MQHVKHLPLYWYRSVHCMRAPSRPHNSTTVRSTVRRTVTLHNIPGGGDNSNPHRATGRGRLCQPGAEAPTFAKTRDSSHRHQLTIPNGFSPIPRRAFSHRRAFYLLASHADSERYIVPWHNVDGHIAHTSHAASVFPQRGTRQA